MATKVDVESWPEWFLGFRVSGLGGSGLGVRVSVLEAQCFGAEALGYEGYGIAGSAFQRLALGFLKTDLASVIYHLENGLKQ